MDYCQKQKRKENPRQKSNLLAQLTFIYALGIFRKGYRKELEEEDIYEVIKSCNSKECGNKIEHEWELENVKSKKKPSLCRLMWKCFGYHYLMFGIANLIFNLFISFVEPQAISSLIGYFVSGQTEISKTQAMKSAATVIGCNLVYVHHINNYDVYLKQLTVKIRASLSSLIYRKTMKLTPEALADLSLGNIVTIITKDMRTVEASISSINDVWVGFIQTFVLFYLIYNEAGWVAFGGVAFVVIILPIQFYLAKYVTKMKFKVCQKSDERLQISGEAFSAIRILKMFTCENIFYNKIKVARKKEVGELLKLFYMYIIIFTIGLLSAKIGFYLVVMMYVWLGYTTTAEQILFLLYCFTYLRGTLAISVPNSVAALAELYASFHRINNILTAEEYPKSTSTNIKREIHATKIELNNVTVNIKNTTLLSNITLKLVPGLCIVTGPVGSGKSSLIKTILKDMQIASGNVIVEGEVSYASQDPWLFPSSIRQNIIFKEKFSKTKYEEVIRVCALRYDLQLLENGDETIIADNGINLSRGQQARINLARAIYKKGDIYLLDDSLTALDNHVQQFIFNECIKGYLKHKLCVLVTHNANFIEKSNCLVRMEDGKIKYFGKPDNPAIKKVQKENSLHDNIGKLVEVNGQSESLVKHKITLDQKKNVYHEIKKCGSVDYHVYNKYFRFGGGLFIFGLIIVVFIFAQITDTYSDKLLSSWINYQQNITDSIKLNDTDTETYKETVKNSEHTIIMYTTMIVSSSCLTLVKHYGIFNFGRKASLKLHNVMSKNMFDSYMKFFDDNFMGNILNRLSLDLNNVDEKLPQNLAECIVILFSIFGSLFLIVSTNWKFLIPMPFLGIIILTIRYIYIPTGRSLRRLEAATKSPLVGYMNSTLDGLTTIRAFKAETVLQDEFDRYQDVYSSADFTGRCCQRALSYYLDMLCTIFLTIVICKFLFEDTDTAIGNVGITIRQAWELADFVQFGVRYWSELETNMTSVERCLEYTDMKAENKTGEIIQNWSPHGKIEYQNVNLTYSNTQEKVLKNINFTILPKQKIGIVGRTGSGKSSIFSVLFRLYDIEGKIKIDSVDTKTIDLEYLRQNISIIPQDPVLFSGTIRSNIDLLGIYTEKEIWEAVNKVKINNLVTSLDMTVKENDLGFSAGQKQLICLARAIVRKNKIVLLDEATANMDPETDSLLHRIIKENFSDCTVLTIAHRLDTVLESDKVMVMDTGVLREFDSPSNLLNDKGSKFYKMVHQSAVTNLT